MIILLIIFFISNITSSKLSQRTDLDTIHTILGIFEIFKVELTSNDKCPCLRKNLQTLSYHDQNVLSNLYKNYFPSYSDMIILLIFFLY